MVCLQEMIGRTKRSLFSLIDLNLAFGSGSHIIKEFAAPNISRKSICEKGAQKYLTIGKRIQLAKRSKQAICLAC
jgi:hypothetical protein